MEWFKIVDEPNILALKHSIGYYNNIPTKITKTPKRRLELINLIKQANINNITNLNFINIELLNDISSIFENTNKKFNFDNWDFMHINIAEDMFKNSIFTYNDIIKIKNKTFQMFLNALRETRNEEQLKEYLGFN